MDYFENHIEGIKQAGFSCAGRLVELTCDNNIQSNFEAEKTAEQILRMRVHLWDTLIRGIDVMSTDQQVIPEKVRHLKIIQ